MFDLILPVVILSILVGLTGVGKTSVLEKAQQFLEFPKIEIVNYGDVLLELAKENGLVQKETIKGLTTEDARQRAE